ncbi:MAG: zinc ABC transporter substrate-binding protein [Acidimicrobiales bacterium]
MVSISPLSERLRPTQAPRRRRRTRAGLVVLAALATALLVGCGSSGGGDGKASDGKVDVVAGFYPLAWMAEQVGGDRVAVTNLTKPGAEPHDLELTPRDVAAVTDADLAVHLAGVQPAVDDAIASSGVRAFDAARSAKLDRTYTPLEGGEVAQDEANSRDPHFWLDPTRMAAVADAFADELGKADPDHAATYEANARQLRSQLEALDRELASGLADCDSKIIATSHNAFGYFAERYGLRQEAIAGVSPEAEPTPAQLAAISRFVERNGVSTIYAETLVDPSAAEAVAKETGAKVAVLDPIEGVTDRSAAKDYPGLLRADLRALRSGLGCS